jgi:hypothetical protein
MFLIFISKSMHIIFLMGLNNSLSNVHGQILLMEPLPPFNKVFSMILQDDRQRQIYASKAFTRSRN